MDQLAIALQDVAGPASFAQSFEEVWADEILVSGLSKSFGQGPVLNDVNFRIKRGEAVALIGSNGAGKSTLLRCILRLIEPSSGSVQLLGSEITLLRGKALRKLRAQIGIVWQRHNLVSRVSTLTNVVHGAQCRSSSPRLWYQALAPRAVREEAMHCLDQVGMVHLASRRADRLSGGESQRVAIARALMQRPKIMMADEPVASLDPKVGVEVMELFIRLIQKEGLTLVFTTHDLRHALDYSDRVLALKSGKIELDARSNTLNEAGLREVYDRAV